MNIVTIVKDKMKTLPYAFKIILLYLLLLLLTNGLLLFSDIFNLNMI